LPPGRLECSCRRAEFCCPFLVLTPAAVVPFFRIQSCLLSFPSVDPLVNGDVIRQWPHCLRSPLRCSLFLIPSSTISFERVLSRRPFLSRVHFRPLVFSLIQASLARPFPLMSHVGYWAFTTWWYHAGASHIKKVSVSLDAHCPTFDNSHCAPDFSLPVRL